MGKYVERFFFERQWEQEDEAAPLLIAIWSFRPFRFSIEIWRWAMGRRSVDLEVLATHKKMIDDFFANVTDEELQQMGKDLESRP